MYQGSAVRLQSLDGGLVELVLDLQGESVNKLNQLTQDEMQQAVTWLSSHASEVKGLLISSAKFLFIAGADITEFSSLFNHSHAEIEKWAWKYHNTLCELEALPFPTVAAVNGVALGGGLETALSADYRVLAEDAKIGLPEVTLGICPGWGGSVRLTRLVGAETAVDWLLSGKPKSAEVAKSLGLADAVVPSESVRDEALLFLQKVIADGDDYQAKRDFKHAVQADNEQWQQTCESIREQYGKKLSPHYPAPIAILSLATSHPVLAFRDALAAEAQCFATLALTDAAKSLTGLFMNDQVLKRKSKAAMKLAHRVDKSAVLGAGIMGGGIAYQSASTGTPIIMKDIREEALELGLNTAGGIMDKAIQRGRMDEAGKDKVLSNITSSLIYDGFESVGYVVEAVVENPKIKAAVLSETEGHISDTAVLASNTSTISITELANSLKKPERFCGMHFFNPVHQMPLVEVIRGEKTNEETIATTVAYANAMRKTPIIVNDCPGFLVNRVLFPYFNGFNRLLLDGVGIERIDQVMEGFGWPMGPAYLADVIGLDTMVHADQVLQAGYPQRMKHDADVIIEVLLAQGALGQKNGRGFYEYGKDESGKRFKKVSSAAQAIINERVGSGMDISDEDIIARMMIPMCLESVRCLDEGIVESPAETDMGLILGLGFPRFRGGPLRYIDTLGLDVFAKQVRTFGDLGGLYQLPESYLQRLDAGQRFF
ncbi:MAG: fatty acid oxidation complex subunit alpha FadB [Neptunomonas phycophila]|uniref:fatty acid oxidation complex subunit alpha FadB n=1 Tax=Neptunomonas phycophila TaxID=1572645 RepID=UPI003B8BEC3B